MTFFLLILATWIVLLVEFFRYVEKREDVRLTSEAKRASLLFHVILLIMGLIYIGFTASNPEEYVDYSLILFPYPVGFIAVAFLPLPSRWSSGIRVMARVLITLVSPVVGLMILLARVGPRL